MLYTPPHHVPCTHNALTRRSPYLKLRPVKKNIQGLRCLRDPFQKMSLLPDDPPAEVFAIVWYVKLVPPEMRMKDGRRVHPGDRFPRQLPCAGLLIPRPHVARVLGDNMRKNHLLFPCTHEKRNQDMISFRNQKKTSQSFLYERYATSE